MKVRPHPSESYDTALLRSLLTEIADHLLIGAWQLPNPDERQCPALLSDAVPTASVDDTRCQRDEGHEGRHCAVREWSVVEWGAQVEGQILSPPCRGPWAAIVANSARLRKIVR
jgi:hypothetical protein